MKRKAENYHQSNGRPEKRSAAAAVAAAVAAEKNVDEHFRKGLFDEEVLGRYTGEYAASLPYVKSLLCFRKPLLVQRLGKPL